MNKFFFSSNPLAFPSFKLSLFISFLIFIVCFPRSPPFIISASRQNCYTDSRSLAGCPILTIFSFGSYACNLSIMLSTAMFDGAQAITFAFCSRTVYRINSTTVVVFPVPGGPWIIATSWERKQVLTARRYASLRPSFTNYSFLDEYCGDSEGLSISGSLFSKRTSTMRWFFHSAYFER